MQTWEHKTAGNKAFASVPDSKSVLRELFELLEDYAPTWYTEEHHNRLASALGEPLIMPAIN